MPGDRSRRAFPLSVTAVTASSREEARGNREKRKEKREGYRAGEQGAVACSIPSISHCGDSFLKRGSAGGIKAYSRLDRGAQQGSTPSLRAEHGVTAVASAKFRSGLRCSSGILEVPEISVLLHLPPAAQSRHPPEGRIKRMSAEPTQYGARVLDRTQCNKMGVGTY